MDVKYASMLNVVFITLTFGIAIPILFPYAAIFFISTYLIETFNLHYSYKKPPSYDDKLTKAVLETLMFAPLFFFGFGYWFLSSK